MGNAETFHHLRFRKARIFENGLNGRINRRGGRHALPSDLDRPERGKRRVGRFPRPADGGDRPPIRFCIVGNREDRRTLKMRGEERRHAVTRRTDSPSDDDWVEDRPPAIGRSASGTREGLRGAVGHCREASLGERQPPLLPSVAATWRVHEPASYLHRPTLPPWFNLGVGGFVGLDDGV